MELNRISRFVIIIGIILIILPILLLTSTLYESETGYFFNTSTSGLNASVILVLIGISLAIVGILSRIIK